MKLSFRFDVETCKMQKTRHEEGLADLPQYFLKIRQRESDVLWLH